MKRQSGMFSAMQLKAGIRHGEVTYLVALVEVKPGMSYEVSDAILDLLAEFEDVMPLELSKELPPRRAMDHKIELIPGSWAPSELVELRKQLDKLLKAGLVQPSKALPMARWSSSKRSKMAHCGFVSTIGR